MASVRDNLGGFGRDFALAVQRFTRLRQIASSLAPADPGTHRSELRHLPGVGWLVGMLACLVFALVSLPLHRNPWGPVVAGLAATIATLLLTGALHETQAFRMAETLFTPSRGYGNLAVGVLLAAKLALLAALAASSEAGVIAALLAAHVVSRFAPLLVRHGGFPASEGDRHTLAISAVWCVVPLLLMLAAHGAGFALSALVCSGLAAYAIARRLRGQVQEETPDSIGAVQQVCEVAFYFGAAIASG